MDIGSAVLSLNTVWVVTSAILVFFMQAGFAMLESGMVRAKNAVNVLMKNYIDLAAGTVAFWMIGFGLMFGTNPTGWFGVDHFFVSGETPWDLSFVFFQMMFAATAATIVSGALAERIRYRAYVVGAVVISSCIYAVFGSWAWGSFVGETQGWLKELGFIDFAGSTVVHSVGGWCALAGVLVIGPRLGRFASDGTPRTIPGHSLPMVALGGMILWIGWFGFNGGSLLEVNDKIGLVVLNTHLAGAGGVLGAIGALVFTGRPLFLATAVNGALGGMVAICAGADVIEPHFSLFIGLVAGVLVTTGIRLLEILQIDDAVGAISVHGFAGVWGTIAVGMFHSENFFDLHQILIQMLGVAAAFIWTFPTACMVFFAIDRWIGLRAGTVAEQRGLDFTEHYEICYPEFQQDLLHQGKL